MVTFKLNNKSPDEILNIVKQLRAEGYIQGQDFDFAYFRTRWDPMIGDMEGFTNFTFYNDKKATMFALKWGSK